MARGYRGMHKQQKCEYLQLHLNTGGSCVDSSSDFVFQTLLERWTAETLFLLQGLVFFFFYSRCSTRGRVFSHLRADGEGCAEM